MEGGTLELSAGVPEEIATARHAFEMRLAEWGCGYIDDIALVFSELVTNAIKHAGGAQRILLQSSNGVIKIAVHDTNPAAPKMRSQADESGGFGLRIVHQLTIDWGWTLAIGGKQVWADISCSD